MKVKMKPDTRLHKRFALTLGENLFCAQGVYLRRWRFETPWFSIRLHHWFHSDDNRNVHDHPWNFYTLILKGSYTDESPKGSQRVSAGHIYYRSAEHAHWVHLDPNTTVWTLVLTGPKIRRWGFWISARNKWTKAYKYFYEFGNHPCE